MKEVTRIPTDAKEISEISQRHTEAVAQRSVLVGFFARSEFMGGHVDEMARCYSGNRW